jgi:ABC-2 type transport system ATP-binding protein
MGTPGEIRGQTVGHARVDVQCGAPLPHGHPSWADAAAVHITPDRRAISVTTRQPARTLVELVRWIDQLGIDVDDVQLKRPTLEDVFIELTGKSLRE